MNFKQIPLNDWLQSQRHLVSGGFSGSQPADMNGWTAVEGGWTKNGPQMPHNLQIADPNSGQVKDWWAQQVLGGKDPAQWVKDWNASKGIGEGFQGWDQGGVRYNPNAGMVTVPGSELGGDELGNFILPAVTAWMGNVGALGSLSGLTGGADTGAASFSGAFDPSSLGSWDVSGLGGADASWGVNPQGGSLDLGDWQDWSSFGQGGGNLMPPAQLDPSVADFLNTGSTVPSGGNIFSANGLNESVLGLGGGSAGFLDTLRNLGLSNRDLVNLGSKGVAALLQAFSSNQQSNALSGLADRYSASGAPSRARFEASMTPGFDPMSIPGYAGALDSSSKALLARLSATGGNPWGNPAGLTEANKALVSGTALPAINEYQRLNLGAGGLANLNAAIPSLQTGAIQNDAGGLAALGSFLGSATAPDNSLAGILKQLQGIKFNDGAGL